MLPATATMLIWVLVRCKDYESKEAERISALSRTSVIRLLFEVPAALSTHLLQLWGEATNCIVAATRERDEDRPAQGDQLASRVLRWTSHPVQPRSSISCISLKWRTG